LVDFYNFSPNKKAPATDLNLAEAIGRNGGLVY
jgi:hypothetical protein